MRLRTIALTCLLLLTVVATTVRVAAAQPSCCTCSDCSTCAASTSGQGGAACAPADPCFANPSSPEACDSFCAQHECSASNIVEDACSTVRCTQESVAAIESQPAPALGALGVALTAFAAALSGAGRLLRRRRA